MKANGKAVTAVTNQFNQTKPMETINTPDVLTVTPDTENGQTVALQTAPSLQIWEKVHPLTGEIVSKYKYLEGHPKQYRFDAKEGVFNINGVDKIGPSLTFQPLAWRIFRDNILNMGTKNWAEIFFIDAQNCVSALLFHGYSVDNIFRLIEPLYYDDQTLADVVITATAERKENGKIKPKGVYHIAKFGYELSDLERTNELKAYAETRKFFRQETLTDVADTKTAHNFYNPFAEGNNGDEETALLTK